MPRNPLKNFRRKSSANALEFATAVEPSSPQSTFRVLERPATDGFDGGNGLNKRLSSGRPLTAKTTSADNLGAYANRYERPVGYKQLSMLTGNRGSGGTTRSGSTGFQDNSSASARFSSSSTLPSSLDVDGEDLFPVRKAPFAVHDEILEPPPTFLSRAGRALSFANKSYKIPPQQIGTSASNSQPTSPYNAHPTSSENDFGRDRAMTTSSYASTAKPPQLDSGLGSSDFGGDFGNMFEGLNGRKMSRDQIPPVPAFPTSARTTEPADAGDAFVPPHAASRQGMTPSPTRLERPQLAATKRYSWDSRNSMDQLMPGSDMGSPGSENLPSSAQGASATSPIPGFSTVKGYQAVPDRYKTPDTPYDRATSPASDAGFMAAPYSRSTREGNQEPQSVWRSELRVPTGDQSKRNSGSSSDIEMQPLPHSSAALNGYNRQAGARSPIRDDLSIADSGLASSSQSMHTTPRAIKAELDINESLFDSSPVGPPSRAINHGKQRATEALPNPKRMTRVQFEQARLGQSKGPYQDGKDSDDSGPEDEEEEDEAERHRQVTLQRRKQEANMAVYRQQMKKVTGGQPSELPSQRPGLSGSLSSMHLGGASGTDAVAGEDEDDDVPLGILQAHGFPNRSRLPSQMPGASPGYAASAAGDVPGNLPAFARRLPTDPYFSLANPSNRETLPYGGGSGSVYGGVSPGGQPGGLVGVIAGEERARAARRGSPNPATGGYGPIPLPSNLLPQMPRSDSMGSFAGVPGLPPAMTPQEMATQQQMQHLMAMQAQMMQQMMAMQQNGGQMPMMPMPGMPMQGSPGMASLGGNGLSPMPNGSPRPASVMSNQGRSMTMSQLPTRSGIENVQQRSSTMGNNLRPQYAGSAYGMPTGPQQGYTPSIAPSERSNVGMPSRYRPVSTLDANGGAPVDSGIARSQTMTSMSFPNAHRTPSPLGMTDGNATKQPKTTIRMVDRPKNAPRGSSQLKALQVDEDDEEGWAEMAKRRADMRAKRHTKTPSATVKPLYDMYQGLD